MKIFYQIKNTNTDKASKELGFCEFGIYMFLKLHGKHSYQELFCPGDSRGNHFYYECVLKELEKDGWIEQTEEVTND